MIRYYAGRVLRDARSQFVDTRTMQLAERACNEGQRS